MADRSNAVATECVECVEHRTTERQFLNNAMLFLEWGNRNEPRLQAGGSKVVNADSPRGLTKVPAERVMIKVPEQVLRNRQIRPNPDYRVLATALLDLSISDRWFADF